jgi:hypothetical protein
MKRGLKPDCLNRWWGAEADTLKNNLLGPGYEIVLRVNWESRSRLRRRRNGEERLGGQRSGGRNQRFGRVNRGTAEL